MNEWQDRVNTTNGNWAQLGISAGIRRVPVRCHLVGNGRNNAPKSLALATGCEAMYLFQKSYYTCISILNRNHFTSEN